ncbi:unnamed protein product [Paramecium sonneborni]|uniref:Uncharacterized protein n=1 Tax=Paramecium sonneborni TaxID=65129 RepID=A0A8S1LX19_9CILI|nr:unnamed protein product [Paramecium sonneborni]
MQQLLQVEKHEEFIKMILYKQRLPIKMESLKRLFLYCCVKIIEN